MNEKPLKNLMMPHRLLEEVRALKALDNRNSRFSFSSSVSGFVFHFKDTPGLLQTADGMSLWNQWTVRIMLPYKYPIDPPLALISPYRHIGRLIHPNVLSVPPHRVCYGRHKANQLLDELALRIQRIICLRPEAAMTDERDALNPRICHVIRRLIREKYVPLTLETSLPEWCKNIGAIRERRNAWF